MSEWSSLKVSVGVLLPWHVFICGGKLFLWLSSSGRVEQLAAPLPDNNLPSLRTESPTHLCPTLCCIIFSMESFWIKFTWFHKYPRKPWPSLNHSPSSPGASVVACLSLCTHRNNSFSFGNWDNNNDAPCTLQLTRPPCLDNGLIGQGLCEASVILQI